MISRSTPLHSTPTDLHASTFSELRFEFLDNSPFLQTSLDTKPKWVFLGLCFLPLPLASESSWKGRWLVRQQRAFNAYRYIQNCLHLAGVICLVFDSTAELRAWKDLRFFFLLRVGIDPSLTLLLVIIPVYRS
jgi:hypothetical protein